MPGAVILPPSNSLDYRAPVLFRLGRRALYAGVTFFALLGFVSVPLGEKTGWGHVQAIARTPAAAQALDELKYSMGEWRHRLMGWLASALKLPSGFAAQPSDSAPAGPNDFSAPHRPQHQLPSKSGPIPKPPRLLQ